jgi:folate-binding protein YgfZ
VALAGRKVTTQLSDTYTRHGAVLAPDGIPLHFGDVNMEYRAALDAAVLLDRSHEGRFQLTGKDRADILDRMTTNDLSVLDTGQGKATLFLNPNGRILDRSIVFNPDDQHLLVLTGPGRGQPLQQYLQRHIFFNDDAQIENLSDVLHHFALHGPAAERIVAAYLPDVDALKTYQMAQAVVAGQHVLFARLKPVSGSHWIILAPKVHAETIWEALVEAHHSDGLVPSGGVVFHALRVRAGLPAAGFELTTAFIPLEIGLWDEISFNKGCYTGQEIIARMESRERMARTIIQLIPKRGIGPGEPLFDEGKTVGQVTSAVTTPTGEHYAIGVVKLANAVRGKWLTVGASDGVGAEISRLLGVQPDFIKQQEAD